MEQQTVKTCCLCKGDFLGHGNNPSPIIYNEKERCCDTCNITKVLPIRLMLKDFKDGKDEEHPHNDEK